VSEPPRLLVVVPARDEAKVIERKLKNLALVEWPALAGDRKHLLRVVDDGSTDSTTEFARNIVARRFADHPHVAAEVLANDGMPGKSGAIARALRNTEPSEEPPGLVVLTDADVVLRERALIALAREFVRDPRLGLACGAQEFCHAIAPDGRPTAPGGGEVAPAAELYDRATAVVRRLESRLGRLFSLHGQLCAWRAGEGLEPTSGIAADDLELMFRARARGFAVRRVADARFLEVKRQGTIARAQAHRRALAYYQAVRGRRSALGRHPLDRLQWVLYRTLPGAAPYGLGALFVVATLAAGLRFGESGSVLAAVLLALALALPPGRTLARRLVTIARAGQAPLVLGDRWDTLRS